MKTVLLTAIVVGGSTIIGALLGIWFSGFCRRFAGWVMAFAAGLMLSAALVGLILPALCYEGNGVLPSVLGGILLGALFLGAAARLLPDPDRAPPSVKADIGEGASERGSGRGLARAGMLFLLAVAVHNLPEGIAAGVGFGTGDEVGAFFIAGSIALQNLPEGMLVVVPLIASGCSAKRALLLGALTGIIEIAGTFIGFFAVKSILLLPFALSFAGGSMLFITVDQMLPEARNDQHPQSTAYAFLLGVCVMLIGDVLLS